MASQAHGDKDEMDFSHDLGRSSLSVRSRIGVGMIANQGRKRGLEGSSLDESSDVGCKKVGREQQNPKVILKFGQENEFRNVGLIALSKDLKKKLGDIELAKVLRDGRLLIICTSEEQKKKALQLEHVCRVSVSERRVIGEKEVRGVITGIPLDEDLEKFRQCLGGGVRAIKRLRRRVDGQSVESLSVLLEFDSAVLPEKVKVGCLSFPVREFVPPPLRCYKCQLYGHVAAVCRGKQRCPRCSGDHRVEECGGNCDFKCCNCGEQHAVTYGGCEVRKKAVEIQKVKVASSISYAEAVRKVQEQNPGGSGDQTGDSGRQQNVDESNKLSMDNLIVFLAYVINCADQAKHKTDKIKIIVKGAEKYLGVNISWEQVNKRLEDEKRVGLGGEVDKIS